MHRLFDKLFGRFAKDILMVGAHSGSGAGVVFATLQKTSVEPTPLQRKRWPQIAAHVGAGLRLRATAHKLPIDAPSTEAIFDASGKLQEARDAAQDPSARDRLRAALQRIDRARTAAGRSDQDGAMDAWEGLIDGRWSLVDRFDSDGRRFVVAVKNDPAFPDPRGLTSRERQISEFVGLGQSSKEIAYTLGVSLSAVTNAVASAMAKLGLSSRAEFAAFFSLASPRAKLAEVMVGEDTLLVASSPLLEKRSLDSLTEAERDVVAHLIAGSTNADIAVRRGSSLSTATTQVQTVYRKLGVHSRSELAARLLVRR
jgi:DNA-binding NarL/FixJ family response regulator